MATVKAPASIPCEFIKPWQGECGIPSTNGRCDEHEGLECVSCGETATGGCDWAVSLVCGAPLCDTCTHVSSEGHVIGRVAQEKRKRELAEREATIASRESPEQRIDEETGLPLNLFELKKGDMEGYAMMGVSYLELEHGLMGFFPAIYRESREIVVTTDQDLLTEVWQLLSPRDSRMQSTPAWVSEELEVCYPIPTGHEARSSYGEERSVPEKLLTRKKFEELLEAEDAPFIWAPGLIGGSMSQEDFMETIRAAAREYGVKLPA